MGPKRQYDDLAQPSKAGSSGDGGGGGGDDRPSKAPRLSPAPPPPPPAQSHSRDQTALPSSLPPLQPPPVDKDAELEEVINVIAAGCTSEWLYQRSLQESFSGRVIPLLRLLTETEIRTEKFYKQYIPENLSVCQFCRKTVRSLDAEASTIQMRALTFALGIPLRVEVVDNSLMDQGVLVKRLDFFHETDWDKGPLRLTRGYLSSSTAPIQLKQGSYNADLLSPDGTPMPTLLCRRDQCDILYRK